MNSVSKQEIDRQLTTAKNDLNILLPDIRRLRVLVLRFPKRGEIGGFSISRKPFVVEGPAIRSSDDIALKTYKLEMADQTNYVLTVSDKGITSSELFDEELKPIDRSAFLAFHQINGKQLCTIKGGPASRLAYKLNGRINKKSGKILSVELPETSYSTAPGILVQALCVLVPNTKQVLTILQEHCDVLDRELCLPTKKGATKTDDTTKITFSSWSRRVGTPKGGFGLGPPTS